MEFWQWWQETGAQRWEQAIREGTPADDALIQETTEQVQTIGPNLAFEFHPGRNTAFGLTVTAQGYAENRAVARRWLNAAPASDIWEFYDLRQPTPGFSISLGETTVSTDDLRFRLNPGDSVLNVDVYHPGITEPNLGFLLLDSAFGERNVEMWFGEINFVTEPGPELSVADVNAEIAELEARFPTTGEGTWRLYESNQGEEHYVARVRPPLHPLSDPLKEIHVRVEIVGVEEKSAEELWDIEDRLEAIEGARLVAVETLTGVRTFHLYAVRECVEQFGAFGTGEAVVDPGWVQVSHLRF